MLFIILLENLFIVTLSIVSINTSIFYKVDWTFCFNHSSLSPVSRNLLTTNIIKGLKLIKNMGKKRPADFRLKRRDIRRGHAHTFCRLSCIQIVVNINSALKFLTCGTVSIPRGKRGDKKQKQKTTPNRFLTCIMPFYAFV